VSLRAAFGRGHEGGACAEPGLRAAGRSGAIDRGAARRLAGGVIAASSSILHFPLVRHLPIVVLGWIAFLATSPAFCGDLVPVSPRVSDTQTVASPFDRLALIRSNLELIEQLRRQGVEVDADGAIARRLLGDAARLTDGRVATLEALEALCAATGSAPAKPERRAGWFTFANVLWLVGACVVVAALGLLARHYLERLVERVPPWAWEVGFYAVCGGAIVAGHWMPVGFRLAPVLPGCIGLLGALGYSRRRRPFRFVQRVPWALACAWGGVAWFYGSETIGFFAVSAALAGLGFAAGMVPGLVEIGFRGRDAVPRATVAAGVLLAAHVALHCSGVSPAWLAPFRAGMGFLGAFVYLLGLLILSSRRYSQYGGKPSNLWTRYASMQAVTAVSGLATIYFGSVHGVDNLLGLGGTFFCLFLLEKYYDLPWRGIGWAWSLLGAGGLLYLFALLVQARPAWFFFMR